MLNLGILLAALPRLAGAPALQINVQADRVAGQVPRLLTGACIEDVNHEIYGGLYSQMVFGESFQEPALIPPPRGFTAYGGQWRVRDAELNFTGAPGDKLVSLLPPFTDGEVGVDVFLADRNWSNVGLLVRVANAAAGTDRFDAYEIALNAAGQNLRLGRHRQNWEPIRDTPCEVPVGRWVSLAVKLEGRALEVFLDDKRIIRHEDGQGALLSGTVGLRAFQSEARYRNLWVRKDSHRTPLPFVVPEGGNAEVSGMWRSVQSGSATGAWAVDQNRPFVGAQSQRLEFIGGKGEVGVENQGLNRWGMHFAGGRPYEGLLRVRTEESCEVWVTLESADGAAIHAESRLWVEAGDWRRIAFSLTPKSTEAKGRFTIKLKQPGTVTLGYAFLGPGEWGRFKGLPVRRDVADALIAQGITVLRYGGSMINHPEYRWKKMIGPRDQRPPHRGTWYPYSSNGWGILDFMDFCEAAGFEYIPAFNMDESPEAMADFIEYCKGPAGSHWGQMRVAAGHPQPYALRWIELGNEERVDERYYAKFKALAEVIWAKDPGVILVVGDFVYGRPITDPFRFTGAASGITSLSAQKQILNLARQRGREVWFDLHVGTEGPRPDATLAGMFSFLDALEGIAQGARFQVAVFEFNAGNHAQRRALANALAIHAIERDGRIPIATSANCLQPDGQNDNGWDQGLLFLNASQVWLQPPGYVTQMLSRNHQPLRVNCQVAAGQTNLDVNAKRSEDGTALVLQVVNPADNGVLAQIHITGFIPRQAVAQVTELAGPLAARNTAGKPDACTPRRSQWRHGMRDGKASRTFPPYSFTVVRFE